MRTGTITTGRFGASTSTDNRTYHRDKDGQFASTGSSFGDRADAALKGDDAVAAAALRFKPSSAQEAAIDRYGGDASYNINSALRTGKGDESFLQDRHRSVVEGLDSVMRPSPLESDIIIHRRVSGPPVFGEETFSRNMTGLTFRDHGYVSTSAQPRASLNEYVAKMKILVPKGTKAISHSQPTGGLDGDEVLLDRGLTFRIVADHGVRDAARVLDVEVVPDDA